jgi:nicotinamidase/pyrazinamidase
MKAFFDIDTQIDFMFSAGALYGAGAERLIPVVSRLNHYAAANGIPLISTMCAHPEDADEFRVWPPHCVVGTVGQQKPPATLVANRARQTIVEKNDLDVFSNPDFIPLLDRLGIEDCYVYGVFLEYCVKCAVLGLLKTGRRVKLVSDATTYVNADAGRKALEEFEAAGGSRYQAITASDI